MPVRRVNYLWDEPHPANAQDFEQLEFRWGVRLPDDYKSIAAFHQGMSPEPSVFNVGRGANMFNVLLTVSPNAEREEYSAMSTFELLKPHLPNGIYPFAGTPGGDYVCFDYRASPEQPKIVFVTVEADIHPLADGFTEFLGKLHD
jgi:cell wall assembly regulator SMI1